MSPKVSQRDLILITRARQEIRALARPAGTEKDTWKRLQRLLSHLAGHLPNVWPSTRTLAKKLEMHQTQIQRDIVTLRNLGRILSIPHSSPGARGEGQEFLLVCLSPGLEADIQRARLAPVLNTRSEHTCVHKSSSSSKKNGPSSLRDSVRCGGCAAAEEALGEEMPTNRHDPAADDPEWAYGANPEAPLPVHAARPIDPGAYLASVFDQSWGEMARRHKEWLGRPSQRGVAIGYIKGTMLAQVDFETAERYIRAFAPAVADGRVTIKSGQLPFMAFTAWWGSEDLEPVSDLPEGFADYVRARRAQRAQEGEAGA